METQETGKTACSSDDVIQSVTKQLKFYLHVRRREDGFDASPSYIPRRAFPSLLPRPILQATRYDVPMKHHFSHTSVRSVLARLQSFQPHKPVSPSDPQTRRMLRTLNRYYRRLHLDHPMLEANQERDDTPDILEDDVTVSGRKKKKFKSLRNGVRTIIRAPPPFVSPMEKQRIMDSTCMLLRSTEMIMEGPKRYYEVGNTKLQRLDKPRPLQYNFMPDVHREVYGTSISYIPIYCGVGTSWLNAVHGASIKLFIICIVWTHDRKSYPISALLRHYVESKKKEIPDSSAIRSGRSWYIYDLDGRRHRIAKVKGNEQAVEVS